MAKFHPLKIAEITRETADCVSVVFDVPVALQNDYKYIQGQYLTLKLMIGGEEIRRSYSVCSSPTADKELRVAIKKVKDGRGSSYMNDLAKAGDTIEVMTPMGNFHSPLDPANKKHYVLFAGGSGITPMMSIIKTVLKDEPGSSITLIYGNRDEASVIFKKQIDALVSAHASRLRVHHVLESGASDALHSGLLTAEKSKELISSHIDLEGNNEYFICGPGPMMENVKQALTGLGADQKRIHIEYFTAVISETAAPAENKTAGENITSKVTVIMDGEKTTFELATDGPAVLDMALDAGLDVPFACKGAVCCTCRAKVLEGKMIMDNNFALTDDEVEQGYVLTCQSHPVTPTVVVDYDQP
ncbi:MAG: ring-1,2-phenylacetyl-CoA epoxidase subunit PaaE [Bacteroidetes bacterium]|nr:MAG: ring-1,2-phenylacetyl-CoA epoxidase subunit PaaE [Bacteroidota bacterium]